jgi:hypothetical protein
LCAAAILAWPLWAVVEVAEAAPAEDAAEARLKKYDKDGDGVLSDAERQAARQDLRKNMQVTNWPEARLLPPAEEAEAPKAEEPKAEEPKAEAPKAEAPKAEAPKAEEPKVKEEGADKKAEEKILTRDDMEATNWPNQRRVRPGAIQVEGGPQRLTPAE